MMRAWSGSSTSTTKSENIRQRRTVQSLGRHCYALPEATRSEDPPWKRMIPILSILFFPISFTVLLLFTACMTLAPTALRQAILARLIPLQMMAVQRMTDNQRKLLLHRVSGRVLDVGSGAGAYMSYLSKKATHVVALEPMSTLHPRIREEAQKAGFKDYQITVSTCSVETYAANNPGMVASFDWIILGNVLCEVENQQSTLDNIHLLLKEGGYVYFSEHVAAPSKTWTRKLQNLFNPWWSRVSGGCNINRDSLFTIEGMADWDVISWEMTNIKLPFAGSFVMGLAQKVSV